MRGGWERKNLKWGGVEIIRRGGLREIDRNLKRVEEGWKRKGGLKEEVKERKDLKRIEKEVGWGLKEDKER